MNLIMPDMIRTNSFRMHSCLSMFARLFCLVLLLPINISLVKAEVKVVSDSPKILEFKVSTVDVKGKRWQQLSWITEGVDSVKLFKNGKEVPGRVELNDGSIGWPSSMSGMRMRLKKDTRFKIIAKNKSGITTSKTAHFEIAVKSDMEKKDLSKSNTKHYPSIKSFYISPQKVSAGDWIKFHWDVKDASEIRLYDDIGEIDLRSDHKRNGGLTSWFSTTIDKTTQFRLVALDGKKKPVAKTFTVMVDKPTNKIRCEVSGKLTGKWRQQVSEMPNGPLTTWVVNVYVSEQGDSRPFTKATVNKHGHYRIRNLEKGKSYTIKPDWIASPERVNYSCDSQKSKSIFNFNVTGSPRLD